jgi:hypothetical protein
LNSGQQEYHIFIMASTFLCILNISITTCAHFKPQWPSPLAPTAITITACFTTLQQLLPQHSTGASAAAQCIIGDLRTVQQWWLALAAAAQQCCCGSSSAMQHTASFSMLHWFTAQQALKNVWAGLAQGKGWGGPGWNYSFQNNDLHI